MSGNLRLAVHSFAAGSLRVIVARTRYKVNTLLIIFCQVSACELNIYVAKLDLCLLNAVTMSGEARVFL